MLPNNTDPREYGLPFSNYANDEVVDPETEETAEQHEKLCVDVAALTHVSPRAIVVCTVAVGAVTVSAYRSVWGDDVTVQPTAAYSGTGAYVLTWNPQGYPDLNPTPERKTVRTPNFIAGKTEVLSGGSVYSTTTGVTSNTATISFLESNTATPVDPTSFAVWVY